MTKLSLIGVGVTLCGVLLTIGAAGVFREGPPPGNRDKLQKLVQEGNFKDAFEGYRKLLLDPQNDPRLVGEDFYGSPSSV